MVEKAEGLLGMEMSIWALALLAFLQSINAFFSPSFESVCYPLGFCVPSHALF